LKCGWSPSTLSTFSPPQTTSPSALHSSDGVSGDKRRRLREFGFDGRLARKGRHAVFFGLVLIVDIASIVENSLTSQSNGRDVICAGKERVRCLSLEISRIEVEGVTALIKLAFKASGCLDQQRRKSMSLSVIRVRNQV
jgi:hypothetical protein